MKNQLNIKALNKRFGDRNAVNNLNIKIDAREAYCLLGSNGAGKHKTTTFNMPLGKLQPDAGSAILITSEVAEQNSGDNHFPTLEYIFYLPENVRHSGAVTPSKRWSKPLFTLFTAGTSRPFKQKINPKRKAASSEPSSRRCAVFNITEFTLKPLSHSLAPLSKHLTLLALAVNSVFAVAEESQQLESIMVIGKATATLSSELAGSYDYMGRDEIAYETVDDIKELFTKVPGVYLSRFNQGIINTSLSIRGFAGDGASPHAKVLIDGIPTNMHNGYAELDQLFPVSINSIEMFRATSDPRHGLFNIAGNYQLNTRTDTNKEIELSLGSFSTREIQGYAGFESGKLSHSYSGGYHENEGYRDHTDIDKKAFSGRWQYAISAQTTLTGMARYSRFEADAPGYFDSPEAARANPEASLPFANQDGGIKENNHFSLHLAHEFNNDVQWSLKAYSQNFKRNRWVRFSEASSLQNRFDDQDQIGFISTVNWQINTAWALNWGVNLQQETVLEQRFGTLSTEQGQTRQRDTSAVIRHRDYDYDNKGTYLQLQHQPSDKLSWNIALRADRLDGDFAEFNAQGERSERDMFDFGTILQPKFNLIYAFSDTVSAFFNAGRSFQHPIGKSAFAAGDTSARDITFNDGAELGMSWRFNNINLRASYWQQNAKDEFVVVDGASQNVGETDRDGVDLAANWEVNDDFGLWANYSVINTEIARPADNQADNIGNELRSVPDFTASVGMHYNATEKLVLRVHLDAQGDYYVNEQNVAGQFGDYTLLNASADYDLDWAILKIQANNITDEFFEYVFDFGGSDGNGNYQANTIHSPGDGRNFTVSLNLPF